MRVILDVFDRKNCYNAERELLVIARYFLVLDVKVKVKV